MSDMFLLSMLIFYSVVVFLLIYLEYSPAVMFIVGVLGCSMFPSCGRNPPCEGLGPVVLSQHLSIMIITKTTVVLGGSSHSVSAHE